MDDLMSRIQEVLSDEESMKQIQELAAMFSQGGTENTQTEEKKETGTEESPVEASDEDEAEADGGFDMGMLFKLMQLFQSDASEDKNSSLLMALKPHLSEEKQAKVDKAVKLMKLYTIWTVVKESGILKDFEL